MQRSFSVIIYYLICVIYFVDIKHASASPWQLAEQSAQWNYLFFKTFFQFLLPSQLVNVVYPVYPEPAGWTEKCILPQKRLKPPRDAALNIEKEWFDCSDLFLLAVWGFIMIGGLQEKETIFLNFKMSYLRKQITCVDAGIWIVWGPSGHLSVVQPSQVARCCLIPKAMHTVDRSVMPGGFCDQPVWIDWQRCDLASEGSNYSAFLFF